MKKGLKVLFVNQEISPYVVGTRMAELGIGFPQKAQEIGLEVRTFMPKFGVINERRNQLHEVIRLSGLNIVIAGEDHPLIIKVASIQSIRLQVYFIDNEDYFLRRGIFHDELGMPYEDNDQRAIFFAKGVLETVKKLRWMPDLIHCNGWFTSFVPTMVRTAYSNDPQLSKAKILYTLYEDNPGESIGPNPQETLANMKLGDETLKALEPATHEALCKLAIQHSDAVALGDTEIDKTLVEYAHSLGKPEFDLRGQKDILPETYEKVYEALFAE